MAEYIEREAVHRMMVGLTRYRWTSPVSTESRATVDADDVNFGVDKIPAADVAPVVHGRWKNITIAVVDTTGYCGVCGEQAVWRSRNKPYAICPNCGAWHVYHTVCGECGYYRGKLAIEKEAAV